MIQNNPKHSKTSQISPKNLKRHEMALSKSSTQSKVTKIGLKQTGTTLKSFIYFKIA
jgi:hypothetical protein